MDWVTKEPWFFSSMLFSLHVIPTAPPFFFLWLSSSFIPLWSENMTEIIFIFIDISAVWKSPTIIVFLSMSPFMSVSICFIYLGAHTLLIFLLGYFSFYYWFINQNIDIIYILYIKDYKHYKNYKYFVISHLPFNFVYYSFCYLEFFFVFI